ncbi:hypothetical protein TTHERM_00470720 (macronuclear) [Tetrahymena thermophila SB210]|uniref:Uncharacterized protein n=1 Tax=Tetrahymena thermophila (strain SB210) TaxID=312017 RepID=I7LTI3_TETTS|nr:hypothetical protein TTHERM_00470720 [Tetrahymena thermophila SB210]EAR85299.2 hypothetical protein TTHERM_00470720 [Tetrahymena thermophila SB210]|eukprot:XP_001032962.2 hypothetical protein TTHERM_00470720 [Tetrahymena thermophila SB210]
MNPASKSQFTHNTNQYQLNPGNSYVQNQYREIIDDTKKEQSQGANLNNEATLQNEDLNRKQLKELFDEFKNKDNKQLHVKDFYDDLERSSVSKNCTLLMQKLKKIFSKNENAQIDENEFYKLFEFDFIQDQDNLNLILGLIDDIANNNKVLSKQELLQMNDNYNLGLQQQDIDLMLKYGGQGDSIHIDDLRRLLSEQ